MKKTVMPQDQVFWYLNRPESGCLRTSLQADVVIIGGGMAGLTAAQAFAEKNKRVILLEAFYCGSGATGKSSGFITPNSEISFAEFVRRYGSVGGTAIWQAIEGGVEYIRANIKRYGIDCDYAPEDTLIVASSPQGVKELHKEDDQLKKLVGKSGFIEKDQLQSYLHSSAFFGGVIYENTFSITAYKYCQAMKEILIKKGVTIFEETPVLDFKNHVVRTLHGTVKAQHIIVCTDRFTPNLGVLRESVYQVQTFLMMSQPLVENEIKKIFPDRRYMVWDTEMIYNYFRLVGNRLALGGGSLLHVYDGKEKHCSSRVYGKLSGYFKKKFPLLDLQFEQFWPGLIGVSKDVAPITGFDKDDPSVYYVITATGLPISAALGMYAADRLIDKRDDLKDYFSPYRKWAVPGWATRILGKKVAFALSNFLSVGGHF
jgi:gamma-glutamylputrescine oxidase